MKFLQWSVDMKRAIAIFTALLFMLGVMLLTYVLYSNHELELKYKDVLCGDKYFTSETEFVGKFSCSLTGKSLCSYEYSVSDGKLYITLYATANSANAMETDEDGYAEIRITTEEPIKNLYYRYEDEEKSMTFGMRYS